MIGVSTSMMEVRRLISAYAPSSAPVLVTGETGTGKEVTARALHQLSRRASGPFVPVPCGAVPESLAESELYGHERGAYTGASDRTEGAFERAHRGVLLLDDIDDLPLNTQSKLVRALETGVFRRVGGTRDIRVDVRVITTSKHDLATAVTKGHFRADLLYRLRGLEIHLAPLRQRPDDIKALMRHFLRLLASGGPSVTLTSDAIAAAQRYTWPGNVRELRRAMECALLTCDGPELQAHHLPHYVLEGESSVDHASPIAVNTRGHQTICLKEAVRHVERELISWALAAEHGCQTRAARRLGVARTTLQSKLDVLEAPLLR